MKGAVRRWVRIKGGRTRDGDRVVVTPLGGVGEIGKNIMAVEYGGDMVLIDAGLAFPEDDMPGIDIVLPDMSYAFERRDRLRALLLTHGHEDHIGAVPYLLREVQVPVIGTRLTCGLVQRKLRQDGMDLPPGSHTFEPGAAIKVGALEFESFRVNHSIPDAVGYALHTPVGTIVVTGDFKFDFTPVDGHVADIQRLARIGADGVLCLFADSTNVLRPGYTPSERLVGEAIATVMRQAEQRVIVTTFASNVHRIQQVFRVAAELGRKVAVVGRSMVDTVDVAMDLGYLEVPPGTYADIEEVSRLPGRQVALLTTGSQGEPLSALSRLASGEHRTLSIERGDTVVLAATPVPGNEKMVHHTINNLSRQGAHVITPGDSGLQVHVSGHASREELKLMHRLIRPAYFVPLHGEYRHLEAHAELARDLGMPADHVIIGDNGSQFEIGPRGVRISGQVSAGKVLVDGLGVGDVGNVVLRDRRQLAQDGILIVQLAVRRDTGEVLSGPEIISRGFVYARESEALLEQARTRVSEAVGEARPEPGAVRAAVRDSLAQFLYGQTGRRPMILPLVVEV
jgi:ribonuclease J